MEVSKIFLFYLSSWIFNNMVSYKTFYNNLKLHEPFNLEDSNIKVIYSIIYVWKLRVYTFQLNARITKLRFFIPWRNRWTQHLCSTVHVNEKHEKVILLICLVIYSAITTPHALYYRDILWDQLWVC